MSGSSIGSIIGGVIGVVLAPFTGGASLAVTGLLMAAGGMIGGMLDPQKLPPQTGPKLSDLSQQTATYGAFIPRLYGTVAVFGNVFWVENNKLKEVATTEVVGGKGGAPEGESTTYKYYATFAVGLCEGPIIGIKRIWVGGKLWYNKGIVDQNTLIVSDNKENKFKLYLGTETQLPHARMQADIGIANCPAYRGIAYLVIEDFELTLYGNSMAGVQIKVEVVKNGAISSESAIRSKVSSTGGLWALAMNGNYVYASYNAAGIIRTYDVSNIDSIKTASSINLATTPNDLFYVDGTLYAANFQQQSISVFSTRNPKQPIFISTLSGLGSGPQQIKVVNNVCFVAMPLFGVKIYDFTIPTAPVFITSIETFIAYGGGCYSIDIVSSYLFLVCKTSNIMLIFDVSTLASPVFISSTAVGDSPSYILIKGLLAYVANNVSANLMIFNIANKASPSLISTFAIATAQTFSISGNFLFMVSGAQAILYVIDISDPNNPFLSKSLITTPYLTQCVASGEGVCFFGTGNTFEAYFYIPHISSAAPTLGSIVLAECLQSKLLSAAEIDVTQLTQPVNGYRVSSQSAIRASIESLQGCWPFDVIQDGYKIKFVARGGSSVLSLTHDKLDARKAGGGYGVKVNKIREMDSVLAAKVTIRYMDYGREYDNGEQYYERINTDSVNMLTLELPLVLTAAEAAGKAQALCYLYWMERYDISFSLPPIYNHLQPTDVITLTTPVMNYILRIKQINYTNDGRLEIQAKYNQASIYVPTTNLGSEGIPAVETLINPGTSTPIFMDIPLMASAQDAAGFPVAIYGKSAAWPGAVMSRSDDAGATYNFIKSFPPPSNIAGFAQNVIPAKPSTVIDSASVLNVDLMAGALASVTQAQMLGGANHFAYGIDGRWEIIAAQNCVLQGDGTYNFTDLLRGRFGTEQHTGTHDIGDYIVYLSPTSIKFLTVSTAQINASRLYLTLTSGASSEYVKRDTFTYTGVNLKPLSPIYLNGNRNPATLDWTLVWIRRSRIDEGWWPLLNSLVGETNESYVIEIYTSAAFTTLIRTLTSATPTVFYPSSNQLTDFGSNQATLNVKIYQVSTIVGKGFPLTQSISR